MLNVELSTKNIEDEPLIKFVEVANKKVVLELFITTGLDEPKLIIAPDKSKFPKILVVPVAEKLFTKSDEVTDAFETAKMSKIELVAYRFLEVREVIEAV